MGLLSYIFSKLRRKPPVPQALATMLTPEDASLKSLVESIRRRSPDLGNMIQCMYCLTSSDPDVRTSAAEYIIRSMESIQRGRLARFEADLGERATWAWNEIKPQWVHRYKWPLHVLGFFSMHPSGFVREAAVQLLPAHGVASVPYLLRRVNDWVEQVRSAAEAGLRQHLADATIDRWAPFLPDVLQLKSRSRADHAWIIQKMQELVLLPQAAPFLLQYITSPDRPTARAAFAMSFKLPEERLAPCLDAAATSHDPVLRLAAVRRTRLLAPSAHRSRLLEAFSRDPFGPVRLEAFYSALETPEPARQHAITHALVDRSGGIREAARFHFKRTTPPGDPRGFYLERLKALDVENASQQTIANLLHGLGECGDSSDFDRLMSFANDTRAGVARAAGLAAATLATNQPQNALLLIHHNSPKVVTRAARILSNHPYAVDVAQLRRVLSESSYPGSRKAAAKALLARAVEDCMPDAIDMIGRNEPEIAQLARDRIKHRYRRGNVPVPPEQMAAIRDALNRNPNLPADIRRRVEHEFGSQSSAHPDGARP